MTIVMDEDIKRWTEKRKNALVLEIIQGKTTVAEASRSDQVPIRFQFTQKNGKGSPFLTYVCE